MKQIVTVAKISGDASAVVLRRFRHWSETVQRDQKRPVLRESEQELAPCCAEMVQFAEGIRGSIGQLPIVFYNEHVDLWSMGDVFTNGFPQNGNLLYEVMPDDNLTLLCYALPDGNALEEYLRRTLRCKHFAEEAEWYLRVLQKAVSAWSSIIDKVVIVVLRQIVGGLVEDNDVREAARLIPPWLEVYNKP